LPTTIGVSAEAAGTVGSGSLNTVVDTVVSLHSNIQQNVPRRAPVPHRMGQCIVQGQPRAAQKRLAGWRALQAAGN
jgi:hypothetical protein